MNAFFSIDIPGWLGQPVHLLAIVGGAAVGAFGSGLLAQGLTRWMTMKSLPRLPTMVVRGLGGVVLGLLTAMWVWQGGSWGPGGPGGAGNAGVGNGDATDPNKDVAAVSPDDAKDKDKTAPQDENPPPPGSVLRLEVLTDQAAGAEAVRQQRFFRVQGEKELMDQAALRELIGKRMKGDPPLQRLDIVTRPDSPDKSSARVEQIRLWASDSGLKVEFPPR